MATHGSDGLHSQAIGKGNSMVYGRLHYNTENERYGVLIKGTWYYEGLHCGESIEVFIDGEWRICSIELAEDWYIAGTFYKGNLENIPVRMQQ